MEFYYFLSIAVSLATLIAFFILVGHVAKIKYHLVKSNRQDYLKDYYKWEILGEAPKAKSSLDEFIWEEFKVIKYTTTKDRLNEKFETLKSEYGDLYIRIGNEFPKEPNWEECFNS